MTTTEARRVPEYNNVTVFLWTWKKRQHNTQANTHTFRWMARGRASNSSRVICGTAARACVCRFCSVLEVPRPWRLLLLFLGLLPLLLMVVVVLPLLLLLAAGLYSRHLGFSDSSLLSCWWCWCWAWAW